ncbi:hypothetical protein D3C87_2079800 [compost metagenome]
MKLGIDKFLSVVSMLLQCAMYLALRNPIAVSDIVAGCFPAKPVSYKEYNSC